MAIDWAKAEEEAGGNFKPYAGDGTYIVKCNDIEIKEVGDKGSIIMKFKFEESDDAVYPSADHWLSFKNDNWRYVHNARLMQVLGATEDGAKKAVEMAEGKNGKDNVVKAYESCYKRLIAKKPEVEIEVYTEDNYARAEFTDRRVAMPHGNEPAKENTEDALAGAEDISDEVDLDDVPF